MSIYEMQKELENSIPKGYQWSISNFNSVTGGTVYINKYYILKESFSFKTLPEALEKSIEWFKKLQPNQTYNFNELRHLSVNYALSCSNGYQGSFDDWFNTISDDWKKHANGIE